MATQIVILNGNLAAELGLNFKEAIQKNKGVSIISEIKKASPSAGILSDNFNHLDIAKMYLENGADPNIQDKDGNMTGGTPDELKQKQQYMGKYKRPDISGRKFEPTFIFKK